MNSHRLRGKQVAPEKIAGELVRARKQARDSHKASASEQDAPLGCELL